MGQTNVESNETNIDSGKSLSSGDRSGKTLSEPLEWFQGSLYAIAVAQGEQVVLKVGIIGGGISGLATAYAIQLKAAQFAKPVQITVLEASERPGGVIRSEHTRGFVCEGGPFGVMDNWPKTLNLCEEAGLQRFMVASRPAADMRYIYLAKQLHRFPSSVLQFFAFRPITLRGRLRVLKEPWSPPATKDDETIGEFGRRHLGAEVTTKFCDVMAAVLFAGDIESLSLRSCFPFAAELDELGNGSLARGGIRHVRRRKRELRAAPETRGDPWLKRGRFLSFEGGIETLVRTLSDTIDGTILLGKRVQRIEKVTSRDTHVIHIDGPVPSLEFDSLVLATPAYASASILSDYDASMASILAEIEYVPLTIVNLGYPKKSVANSLDGHGFLIPFVEGRPIIGIQYMSSVLDGMAPTGHVLLRAWVGGAHRPELTALGDEALADTVHKTISPILGISTRPTFTNFSRYEKAFPQYNVGHAYRLKRLEELLGQHRGLFLTGSAYRGAMINDCVLNGFKIADQVLHAASQSASIGVS